MCKIKIFFFIGLIWCLGLCEVEGADWVSFTGEPEGPPEVTVLESDDDHTLIEVSTPGMYVEEIDVDGEIFDVITLPDIFLGGEIGKPQIPGLGEFVAVPGIKDINLDVLEIETTTLDGYWVYPAQPPPSSPDPEPDFVIDRDFYQSDSYYPENNVELGGAAIWRDLRIVNPGVYPVRFNPALQTIEAAYYIKLELTYSGTSDDNTKEDPDYPIEEKFAENYKASIVNYDWLGLEETPIDMGNVDYLIITEAMFEPTLEPLINWLTEKRYSVKIARTTDPEVGSTWQSIKEYIKKTFEGNRTQYVLLVGDIMKVPTTYVNARYQTSNSDILSDHWYVCVAGDDIIPDLAIGRFSVIGTANLSNQIEKILNYEKHVTSGVWVEKALLVASKESSEVPESDPTDNKEKVRTDPELIYPPVFDCLYGGFGAKNEHVVNAINAGRGIVNYRGHGSETSWSAWDADDQSWSPTQIYNLDNEGYTPVVLGICCWNSKLDHQQPCLSECWLTAYPGDGSYGAVAALGNSRTCWAPTNFYYDRAIFRSLFRWGIYEIGYVVNHAKGDLIKTASIYSGTITGYKDCAADTVLMSLILGDPSMDIRTKESVNFQVNHTASVPVGYSFVEVEVLGPAAVAPVENAVVCLHKEGEVHEAYTTDVDGLISFDIETDSVGEITVTVTKQGYIPNQSTIDVTGE